jgi:hypothetical protein
LRVNYQTPTEWNHADGPFPDNDDCFEPGLSNIHIGSIDLPASLQYQATLVSWIPDSPADDIYHLADADDIRGAIWFGLAGGYRDFDFSYL